MITWFCVAKQEFHGIMKKYSYLASLLESTLFLYLSVSQNYFLYSGKKNSRKSLEKNLQKDFILQLTTEQEKKKADYFEKL